MIIKILKSKIKNIKISKSHINNNAVIKLSYDLLDEANLIDGEKVLVFNNVDNKPHHAFVERIEGNDNDQVIASVAIGGPNDRITIISMASMDIDSAREYSAIIIDKDKVYV